MRPSVLMMGTIACLQIVVGAKVVVAQAGSVHACSLVSEADVKKITGKAQPAGVPPDKSAMPNGATQCNYVGLDISLTPGVTSQNFETNRKSALQTRNTATEPVAGVGEEAYFLIRTRTSSANVGVVFRVGRYQVALGDRVPTDSVAWLKPKVVELAKIAAAKLK